MMPGQAGGNVVLELVDESAQVVRYRAWIEHDGTRHESLVRVTLDDGAVDFVAWTPPTPPGWLLDYARMFLRSAWRRRAEEPWPRRLNRWRDAK